MRSALALVLLAGAACGDDGVATDAAVVDGATDVDGSVPTVTGPMPPASPQIDCPTGFVATELADGVPACDAWPGGAPAACADDEAHFVGEPACTPVGRPCPVDDFSADAPTDAIFVLAGARGGDGSRAAPFATIAEALAVASPGATIAIGRGRYDELSRIARRDLVLLGACPRETILTATSSRLANDAVVLVAAPGVALRDLTIADSVVVGVRVTEGASAIMERVLVQRAADEAISVEGTGTLDARDIAIRDGAPRADGTRGRGLVARGGGTIRLERAVISRARDIGVVAVGASSTIELVRVAVLDTESQAADGSWGNGIFVQDGGAVIARESVVSGSREAGVNAQTEGASVTLEDSRVSQTRTRTSGRTYGRGLNASLGARIVATRVVVDDNHDIGAFASMGATLSLTDVVIHGTLPTERADEFGRGIDLQSGAALDAHRLVVSASHDGGAGAVDEGTTLVLEDARIVDVAPRASDGAFGRGIDCTLGARCSLTRATVERTHSIAVFAAGATLDLTDVAIFDTESTALGGREGRGLAAQDGSVATLTRVRFERNREVTVTAHHEGTRVVGTDVAILDSRPAACAETTCPDNPGGMGLGATLGAGIDLRRFVIDEAPGCGAQVAVAGGVDLHSGVVRRCGIGACIQEPGFDVSRVNDAVSYTDNGTNLDTTSLPVPDPSAARDAL